MTMTDVDGMAQITMSHEQLGILRYALAIGADKLISTAMFHESMKDNESRPARRIADKAQLVHAELEKVVLEWAHN